MLEQAAQHRRPADERVAQAAACAAHRRVAPPQQPLQSTALAAGRCHVVCLGAPATHKGGKPRQQSVIITAHWAAAVLCLYA